jgi:hypothetical protein
MFNVRGSMDQILDELVQACSELKAKVIKVDREKHEVEGKSKTTWLKWGSEFRIGVFKGPSNTFVVMDDLASVPNDFFIKDFYKVFSKRVQCSPFRPASRINLLGTANSTGAKTL